MRGAYKTGSGGMYSLPEPVFYPLAGAFGIASGQKESSFMWENMKEHGGDAEGARTLDLQRDRLAF